MRASGTLDPGLCLQLHNGNFTVGNNLALWDCSLGRDSTMSFAYSDKKLRLPGPNGVDYCATASPAGAVLLARCAVGADPTQDWTLPAPRPPPPPPSQLPIAFASFTTPGVYEPAAPANFTYSGPLTTYSAAAPPRTDPHAQPVFTASEGPTVRWHGLPEAAVEFIPGDGNIVRLANGTWIASVGMWFAKDAPTNVSLPTVKCCNDSVAIFRSDDKQFGLDWHYVGMVGTPTTFQAEGGDEGPNENALLLHPDGQTITILLRTAGGEGSEHHRHLPYFRSVSTDGASQPPHNRPLSADVRDRWRQAARAGARGRGRRTL